MKTKIIFIGTPLFGAIILEGLVNNGYKPVLVITAPDKPAGRKQILTPQEVKITAGKHNISLLQPEKIKDAESKIKELNPDLIITAGYGQILPKNILDIPKYGCLNVHPSLLPEYRGASPIQSAILNGEKKTGVTIILMNEKVDRGDIISNFKFQISNKIYYQELEKELAEKGAKLLIKTIPKWIKGEIKAKPQDESKASYTKIIRKEDGKINWKKPAEEIERQIRAFEPWPGVFTFLKKDDKNLRVKILDADISKKDMPGKLSVKCGKDYLIIKKIQPEGKKPMTAEEFLHGYSNFIIQY